MHSTTALVLSLVAVVALVACAAEATQHGPAVTIPPSTTGGARLSSRTDPIAEDSGHAHPEVGQAADLSAIALSEFLHRRWSFPAGLSQGDANKLCSIFQVSVSPDMVIWHLKLPPVRKSGNDLFDDSAREVLQKLVDGRIPLPVPPDSVVRGRAVNIVMSGGVGARCD